MRTSPDPRQFALNPAHYGLPTRADLVAVRIWDIHYHGLEGGNLRRHKETQFYVERMGIERVLSLDIAGSQARPAGPLRLGRGAEGDPAVSRGARRPGFRTDPD